MRMYDYFSYKPTVGDVVVLRHENWYHSADLKYKHLKLISEGEILIVVDAEYQTLITFLSKDGPVIGAGICGDSSRRAWNNLYKICI